MGNREDLLEGAVRCLCEQGWARTTVRDIAAAAGVSHAAIGYHFGSREALLTAALIRALDEWGDTVAKAVAQNSPDGDPLAAQWEAMISTFATQRSLWRASIDASVQAEHHPKLRELLADGQEEGRRGGAAGLLGLPEDELPEDVVRTLGSVQNALISGVMIQWILDPERAPSGAEVAAGLRMMADLIERADGGEAESRTKSAPVR
jgi:AcrR family transcriptional regulator